ncbi:hypothetical protein HXY32_08125, partial [Candidatus Bathyarchaeota archaeon]|nr:hypothetical protein [Candidatus Bathyarchaeota archaeon]
KQQATKETEDKSSEITTTQYLIETIKQLQTDNENLKLELKKAKGIPSSKIGLAFMIPGTLALIFSIINNSNVLAFIGLGLTFWGALFFFVRPVRYVQSSLLDSTAISTYTTIDRIVKDLKFKGKSYYIPPYPKEVYLPEYLKGLKEPVVFISADTGGMPSIEELAKSKFLLENPNGICIAPPGLGLLTQFEKELRKDITKLQLSELCESLPPIIVENLQLAKELELTTEDNQVSLRLLDSTYKNLYTAEEKLKSIHYLGCPIISAIACTIAKVTGKMITIQKDSISPDGQTIEVWYSLIQG